MIVIVPSRGRPQRAATMRESALATAAGAVRIVIAVDPDDPELDAYRELDVEVLPKRLGYSGTLNRVAQETWDTHDILGAFGDDVIFRTPGWDDAVREALVTPGLAFPNDLAHGAAHPTAVFMSSAIAKALGYLALPVCHHQYVDNGWKQLGDRLGILRYLPDVVVEHMHEAYGKAEMDDTYRSVYSQPQAGLDKEAFMQWKDLGGLHEDAERVRVFL